MSLADTITRLGSSIINVITKGIQGVADYINDNLGNVPDADGTSLSMYTFVNETAVDTLETTNKTIVGSINELKESSGGGGDVTAAGDNTFTGMNIFAGNDKLLVADAGVTNYNTVAELVKNGEILDTSGGSSLTVYMTFGTTTLNNVFMKNPFVRLYDSEQSKYLAKVMLNESHIATTISADSTDTQVPSAKCVYDLIGNIEALLSEV